MKLLALIAASLIAGSAAAQTADLSLKLDSDTRYKAGEISARDRYKRRPPTPQRRPAYV